MRFCSYLHFTMKRIRQMAVLPHLDKPETKIACGERRTDGYFLGIFDKSGRGFCCKNKKGKIQAISCSYKLD